MALILGIDAGTTSLKTGVFDDRGLQLAVAGEEYALHTPDALRAELDPEAYWRALRSTVARALERAGARPADVGLTGAVRAAVALAGSARTKADLSGGVRANVTLD